MLDGEDRNEQSQRNFEYATNKTINNAAINPDPILVWAQRGKLNPVLENSVLLIRKAISYLSRDTGVQSLNYYSLDCPGGRSLTRITDEDLSLRRYLELSPKVISKYGQGGFRQVTGSIIEGEECDWNLFHSAIKIF